MSVVDDARPPASDEVAHSRIHTPFPKSLLPLLVPLAGDALKRLDTENRSSGNGLPVSAVPSVPTTSGGWIAVAQSCRTALRFDDSQYWSSSTIQRGNHDRCPPGTDASLPSTSRGSSTLSISGDLPVVSSESSICFPDCKDVQGSFFNTRHDACVARAYGSAGVVGLLPIAVDHPGGSSAKRYQIIERALLPSFVEGVTDPLQRNFYCLVDDVHPVSPYFDIDGSFDSLPLAYCETLRASLLAEQGPDGGAVSLSSSELRHAALEDILVRTLEVLRVELVRYFSLECAAPVVDQPGEGGQSSSSVRVDSVLVLCASDCGGAAADAPREGKISFHLHFNLVACESQSSSSTAGAGSLAPALVCFDSVTHHKLFAEALSHRLLQRRERLDEDPHAAESAAIVLTLLDFTVYTRWRPFRLPYCMKSFDWSALTSLASPIATLDPGNGSRGAHRGLLSERVALQDAIAGALSRTASLGCTTLSTCVTCNPHHEALCRAHPKLALRPLLPLSAASTAALRPATRAALVAASCVTAAEGALENADSVALVHRVFRMASIVHEGPIRPNKRSRDSDAGDGTSPSSHEPRAFPVGRRVAVTSWTMRQQALRLFHCLHPTAFASLRAEHLNLVFEDGGQRAWYVYQKQNKYCLMLQRYHQHTCGQLYLTYNSVKFRCYSNDCGTKKCWQCKWQRPQDDAPPPTGGAEHLPNYETLRELRGVFFPELTAEELAVRYPNSLPAETEKDHVDVQRE